MFAVVTVLVGLAISIVMVEGIFRLLEIRRERSSAHEGTGGEPVPDPRWGWKPKPGPYRIASSEFEMTGTVDSLYMNNPGVYRPVRADTTRIFVLGDSHTYAYGVSASQSWPAVLDVALNGASTSRTFTVHNGAAVGYSLHQYLLRLVDQGDTVRPDYVIVGISYASDLYDLLPPSRGGWVYGVGAARAYFDFDADGTLVERNWVPDLGSVGQDGLATTPAARVRRVLWYSATFRYLRRSKLALWVGSRVRIGGKSLWPNMEIVVERQPGAEHEYQWKLFEALVEKLNSESQRRGAKLVVVGIPYIAQVYDDLWNTTYGKEPRFSRTAAIERVRSFCVAHGIDYVDTLEPMRRYSAKTGRQVHYRVDGHPTSEGHRVIAEAVLASRALER
jgi:lysophospholipase L1-like esterase